MKITLNGKAHEEFEAPLSVAELLASLEFSGQPVLAELNEPALHRREVETAKIEDGAKLEIIRIAAGG